MVQHFQKSFHHVSFKEIFCLQNSLTETSSACGKADKLHLKWSKFQQFFMSYLSSDFSSRVHLRADLDEGRPHAEVLQQLSADVL